jgi:hypothetical protein
MLLDTAGLKKKKKTTLFSVLPRIGKRAEVCSAVSMGRSRKYGGRDDGPTCPVQRERDRQ